MADGTVKTIKDIRIGDIKAKPDHGRRELVFDGLVRHSGNSTIRIILRDKTPELRERVLENFAKWPLLRVSTASQRALGAGLFAWVAVTVAVRHWVHMRINGCGSMWTAGRRQWNIFKSGRAQIDDPSRGADLFGLPSEMHDDLLANIVPGSGRILPGSR